MADHIRIYESIAPISREAALEALRSADSDRAGSSLLSLALHETDWRWVQDLCIEYADSPHAHVREMAIQSLGHIGRVNAQIDAERVIPFLLSQLEDNEGVVSGTAAEALSDLQIFCQPHDYSRQDVLADLASGSIPRIFLRLFDIARREPEPGFALAKCIMFISHENFAVRAASIDAMAELPERLSPADSEAAKNLIANFTTDSHWWVRQKANSALRSYELFGCNKRT